jgi:hypothetical protein
MACSLRPGYALVDICCQWLDWLAAADSSVEVNAAAAQTLLIAVLPVILDWYHPRAWSALKVKRPTRIRY